MKHAYALNCSIAVVAISCPSSSIHDSWPSRNSRLILSEPKCHSGNEGVMGRFNNLYHCVCVLRNVVSRLPTFLTRYEQMPRHYILPSGLRLSAGNQSANSRSSAINVYMIQNKRVVTDTRIMGNEFNQSPKARSTYAYGMRGVVCGKHCLSAFHRNR